MDRRHSDRPLFGTRPHRPEWVQLALGLAALTAGLGVYLLDRPITSSDLFHDHLWLESVVRSLPNPYGPLGPFAPELLHPLGLSLVSASLFSQLGAKRILCATWFAIDASFEAGQAFGASLAHQLPGTLLETPVIGYVVDALVRETFDPFDVLAITLGSLSALLIVEIGSRRGVSR